MPEEAIPINITSEPLVRVNDFVEFLQNNLTEKEQNEIVRVIIDRLIKSRDTEHATLTRRLDNLHKASKELEDILKQNC